MHWKRFPAFFIHLSVQIRMSTCLFVLVYQTSSQRR
ncbi:hypothetical protein X942_5858 [Burkholderia pseudomallei MSHR5596]|nr:hypothetical protein X942_5858 [Burkholderia pseudomallei MSHR5596]